MMSTGLGTKLKKGSAAQGPPISGEVLDHGILGENLFRRMLWLERKRTERSHQRFALLILDVGGLLSTRRREEACFNFLRVLSESTRDTDIKGWYKERASIGVIFTDIGATDGRVITSALLTKVTTALSSAFRIEDLVEIRLAFHVYPEDGHADEDPNGPGGANGRPNLTDDPNHTPTSLAVKRAMDIVGSTVALILCAPVCGLIAFLIKATSRGPIFFRQVRVGQYGKPFTFLKFRSMYTQSDQTIHREYMKRFIAGAGGPERTADEPFKITLDSRVTPIGKFLRRTSLDELPQLLNVLRGEMSLVGPRPPIPYEVACYERWHRRRLSAAKPGITGMWQVEGRSRVPFDEMVRLDLRYAQTWSVWLDLKILLRTPYAVLAGDGAY